MSTVQFASREAFLKHWLHRIWVEPAEELEEAFALYWAVNAPVDGLGGVSYQERDDTIAFIRAFRSSFVLVEVFSHHFQESEGGWVTCVIEVRIDTKDGCHIVLPGMIRAKIDRVAWRMEESSNYIDFLPLLEQMGAVPEGALMKALGGARFS